MSDKNASETNEFLSAMQGVKRIHDDHIAPTSPGKKPPKPNANQRYRQEMAQKEEESFVDGLSSSAVEVVQSEDELLFATPGIQIRMLQRLRKGHIPWEAGLDLHGNTIEEARNELARFIRDSHEQNLRCVLVVHGKAYSQQGQQATIKSYVNDWLRQLRPVLAFSSAEPVDGGTGALYVLLRTSKKR